MMKRILTYLMRMAVAVALFAGLPLVGWGLGDLAGFATNGARLAYLVMIITAMVVTVILLPPMSREQQRGQKHLWRQHIALILLQLLTLASVVIAPLCDRRQLLVWEESPSLRFIGLGILTFGYILMIGAVMALSRQFSYEVTLQKDHQLITTGLYRYVRHPRYVGIFLFFFGFALLFGSWIALALSAALFVVLMWRIHDEEILLGGQFGQTWNEYAARSWRLCPGIY